MIISEISLIGDRDEQQDHIFSDRSGDCLFAVVSDGAGGLRNGAEASKAVISTARSCWDNVSGNPRRIDAFLDDFSKQAHRKVQALGVGEDAPRATVVALVVKDHDLAWVHSGDSRLYRFNNCLFKTRTKDHSILQLLVDQGKIKDSEMGTHPDQGKLYSCLGGEGEAVIDFGNATLEPDDAFLLCSDGFWEYVPVEEMEILTSRASDRMQHELDQLAHKAVRRARGSADNVSAIVVTLEDSKVAKKSLIKRYLSRLSFK